MSTYEPDERAQRRRQLCDGLRRLGINPSLIPEGGLTIDRYSGGATLYWDEVVTRSDGSVDYGTNGYPQCVVRARQLTLDELELLQ